MDRDKVRKAYWATEDRLDALLRSWADSKWSVPIAIFILALALYLAM